MYGQYIRDSDSDGETAGDAHIRVWSIYSYLDHISTRRDSDSDGETDGDASFDNEQALGLRAHRMVRASFIYEYSSIYSYIDHTRIYMKGHIWSIYEARSTPNRLSGSAPTAWYVLVGRAGTSGLYEEL
jgi:hypothetical protein